MYAFSPWPNFGNYFQAKDRTSGRSSATVIFSMRAGQQQSSVELKMVGSISTKSSGVSDSNSKTVGIIGGVSVFSTLLFLEKLVWWSSRHGNECVPFVVCSDPSLSREFPRHNAISSLYGRNDQQDLGAVHSVIVENLRRKRDFLERSGSGCIVMPCHILHSWYAEISQGCSVPFLHLGDCVARELEEENLKPLEAGSKIRIGLISSFTTMKAGFYQGRVRNQGFEVLLPDRETTEHILLPAITALYRKDAKGGQNLLRIAVNILLMRGASKVVIASDKLQGLLPMDDPLAKKCIDPYEALARSTIARARSVGKITQIVSEQNSIA